MSHFTVLVIGDEVDEQLAQYQENNMADVPKEYLEFEEDNECDVDAETGKRGHWYNPNTTWDWHVILKSCLKTLSRLSRGLKNKRL